MLYEWNYWSLKLKVSFWILYLCILMYTHYNSVLRKRKKGKMKMYNLPRLVRFTRVRVLVPSTVRIVNATKAIVVSSRAHHQVYLLYSMVRSYVKSLVLLRDFHRLDRLAWCHVKNVQQDRLGLPIIVYPLNNFVHASITCNTQKKWI